MSPTRCARDTSIFAARRGKRNGEKRKGEMGDGDRGGWCVVERGSPVAEERAVVFLFFSVGGGGIESAAEGGREGGRLTMIKQQPSCWLLSPLRCWRRWNESLSLTPRGLLPSLFSSSTLVQTKQAAMSVRNSPTVRNAASLVFSVIAHFFLCVNPVDNEAR